MCLDEAKPLDESELPEFDSLAQLKCSGHYSLY